MKIRLALAALALLASPALAQTDPQVFGNGTETTTRYNPGYTETTAFMNCFVDAQGGTKMRVNALTVGIRRVGTTTAPAPAVGVEVSIAEMRWDGTAFGKGDTVATFTRELAQSTATLTEQVTFTVDDPATRPVVNLETTWSTQGRGGFWVGVRFTGPNAGNTLNGWRVVNAPAIGFALNGFGLLNRFDAATGTFSGVFQALYNFGTDAATGTENPARLFLNVSGKVVDPTQLFGGATETGTRFNPGSSETVTYANAFVPAQPGQAYRPTKLQVGIRRVGSTATPAPAIGVDVAIAEMTWDGTDFGVGDVVAARSFNLDVSTATLTQRLTLDFPDASTRPTVDLETASNPGLGGFWVSVRFTGDSAADAINGWRVVNAPTLGASVNGFGLFNQVDPTTGLPSGIFDAWFNFGNDAAGVQNPARLLVDAFGTVEEPAPACPPDLNSDGSVNGQDLGVLLGAWGACANPASCAADLNADGSVNGQDLGVLLGAWGPCAP